MSLWLRALWLRALRLRAWSYEPWSWEPDRRSGITGGAARPLAGAASSVRRRRTCERGSADLDGAAALLELLLELLGLLLGDALLDGLRRALDQVLGLLEAQARDLAHDLDHRDLLVRRGGLEDHVEAGLLLGRG